MKKLLYLLLLAVPVLAFTSCSDDDDLPDVNFQVSIEGAVNVDGTFYVVQGQSFTIESITVVNQDKGKNALITAATYYWDYYRLGSSLIPPYGFQIVTDPETPVGNHLLEIECPVYAVDKTPANALLAYDVEVVASADDIPEGGTTTFVVTPKVQKGE